MSSDAQPTKNFRLTKVRQLSARRYPETFHRPAAIRQRRRVWRYIGGTPFPCQHASLIFFAKDSQEGMKALINMGKKRFPQAHKI
ncbi:MAG: hypothetical protein EBU34_03940 [Alphaproteobacteria bacterium]|jgi:hypothetical protein|nr:hypothetical protein [Alphaproteobacteria bacterium]